MSGDRSYTIGQVTMKWGNMTAPVPYRSLAIRRARSRPLTDAGRELFEQLRPAALQVNEMLTGNLSDPEKQSLDRLLAKIVDDGERAAS